MAMVQLQRGDMFDGPSDLIVLPCSTAGTMTRHVLEKLIYFIPKIPYPTPGMQLGDVQIMPFEGGESIAQYIAYAASVEAHNSSQSAIHRIGVQLGDFTKQVQAIRLITTPLLGAGAGGLRSEVVVRALYDGFKSSAHRDATLVIRVPHQDVFEHLYTAIYYDVKKTEQDRQSLEKPLRVFLSYSHSSPEHKQWVETLATFLRENGIDAHLDSWHLRPGMDLLHFMINELALADRVIIVSDEKYAEKADGRVGGVGWETGIVQGDMFRLPPDSTKYIVIVHSKNLDDGLPSYLKTKFVIHWPDENLEHHNCQVLLKELYCYIPVPPIGSRLLFL